MNGYGLYTWSDGKKYEGYFVQGLMHGKGKIMYLNGSYYDGEHKND